MSQAGALDAVGHNPAIPTLFVANVGSATPAGNTLDIFGASTTAGTNPVQTVGSGNTITTNVQTSQAIAATDATKIGLSVFNSNQFSVDANGFVSLAGGGQAIDSIAVQTGTSPITPTVAGLVTINGATVAAGTNPVRTDGTGTNTMAVEVQMSQAIGTTDATKVGLATFNSAQFSVDANGFVSSTVAPGITTFTGNSGTASPSAGNINLFGTGSTTTVASGSMVTTELTGLTNHAVLVGAGTATITNVGPTSTSGQVLQSQGVAADPAFSTATYPSTIAINELLYSSAANVVSGLSPGFRSVLTGNSSNVPTWTSINGNGLLIIGSNSTQPAAANLTAGTGVSIVNGANSITINAIGTGLTWSDQSGSFNAVSNNGYFITTTATPTLPASPTNGDVIAFVVLTATTCTITGNTSQKINLAGSTSAAAGTCVTSTAGNTIKFVYRSTGTTWWATDSVGSWTIT